MPEAKGISNSISGLVDPAAEKAGTTSGSKYVGALKKVIAGAAIGKWIGDSVLAGGDLEQALGGIETLYKGASDKMQGYASQAYKTAGIDSTTYMEQVTSFSAGLITSMGGDVDAAADVANQAMIDMADNANKMGTPIENIQTAYQGFAKQNYTMLDNLKLGYGGTKTEMERLLADAQKITGVEYNIDNLSDVYEAIHVIQTEIGITGTTQEEAAATISGSIGMMKASYKDLIANLALGNDVFPQIQNLISSTITMLGNVLPAIGNVITGIPTAIYTHWPEIVAAVQTTIANVLTSIKNNFPRFRAQAVTILTNIGTAIINGIPKLLSSISQMIKTAISLIKQYMPSILSAVGLILANLLKTLVKNIPTILKSAFNLGKTIIKSSLSLIKTIATSAFAGFKTLVSTLFRDIISKAREKLNSIRELVKEKILAVKNKIISGVAGFAYQFAKPFIDAKTKAREKLNEIKTMVGTKITELKTKITNGVSSIKEKITKPFTDAKETIDGIIEKIKGFFPLSLGKIFSGIQLPHFKISGGKIPWGIAGKGTPPSVSVEWYAKGGIMNDPTLIGAGEAGAEAILPLDPFWAKMDRLIDGVSETEGNITVNVYGSPGMNVNELAEAVEQKIIEAQKRRKYAWQ